MRAIDRRPVRACSLIVAMVAAFLALAPAVHGQSPPGPRAIADAFTRLPFDPGLLGAGYRMRDRIRLDNDLPPFGRVPTVGFRFDGPRGEIHAGALLFAATVDADRYQGDFPRIHAEAYRSAAWHVAVPVPIGTPEAICLTGAGSKELICNLREPGLAAVVSVIMVPPPLDQYALAFLREAAVRQHATEAMQAVLPGVRRHLAHARTAASGPAPVPDAADTAARLFRDAARAQPPPASPAHPAALFRRDYPPPTREQPGRTIGWMKDATEPAFAAAIALKRPLVLAIVDAGAASHRLVADVLPCPRINALSGQAIFAIADIATDALARQEFEGTGLKRSELPVIVVFRHNAGKLDGSWLVDHVDPTPIVEAIARLLRVPVPAPPALAAVGTYGALRPQACGR